MGSPVPGEVIMEVVTQLEDLLERARAGNIKGIAYVTLCEDDCTTYGDAGWITRAVMGTLHILMHSLCKADVDAP